MFNANLPLKKLLYCLTLSLFLYITATGQLPKLKDRIRSRIGAKAESVQFNLFTTGNPNTQSKQLGNYRQFTLNTSQLSRLYKQKPDQFEMPLTIGGATETIYFIKAAITDSATKFTISDASGQHEVKGYEPGVFYHGILLNKKEESFITAAVFNRQIRLFISFKNKNTQVNPVDDLSQKGSSYGMFENLPGNNEPIPFSCGTNEDKAAAPTTAPVTGKVAAPQRFNGKVVRVYFDCSYKYYQHYNSNAKIAYDRITALFNQAALCYANESVNMAIAGINIWTSADPYNHTTRDEGLSSFKRTLKNNYPGNIAMLCDWADGNSGLADGIGTACVPFSNSADGPYIYNDLNYNNNFKKFPIPADAPQTYLIIHEMGHILGSRHTQWCGWPGGPIDDCFTVEGSCDPGPTPAQGTMMSYCCVKAIGIDFNAGFGPLPSNAVRNFISEQVCMNNGANNCDESLLVSTPITGSDYTKFEASNTITSNSKLNKNANVLFDAGSKVILAPGFIAPQGSKLHIVNEGCGGLYRVVNKVPKPVAAEIKK